MDHLSSVAVMSCCPSSCLVYSQASFTSSASYPFASSSADLLDVAWKATSWFCIWKQGPKEKIKEQLQVADLL